MQRISPIDTFFLASDSPQSPMNIGGLTVLDPSTAPNKRAPTYEEFLDYAKARLHLVPNLRRRLVFHPLGMDEPRLVDDPDFDIEFHVRHLALPGARDGRELKKLVSRIIGQSMDMQRPLWELYLVEGLDHVEGVPPHAYAFVAKFHHAVFDGAAVGATLFAFMQDSPDQGPPDAPVRPWKANPKPALKDWMSTALQDSVRQWFDSVGAMTGVGTQLASTLQSKMVESLGRVPVAGPKVPKTRFQERVTSHRAFDYISLPMNELQQVRAALGKPKMNDLMIAIVGGALRRYLTKHGELPQEPLQALCPINVREGAASEGGNQLSAMRVTMGTDIADPVARLAAVAHSSVAAKATAASLGSNFMSNLLLLNPYPQRMRLLGGLNALGDNFELVPPTLANAVVTNSPPPKGGHYFAGSRVVTSPAFGPLFHDCGLLHAIAGQDFESTIAVTTCREYMPDIEFYIRCIGESFGDYRRAAGLTDAEPAVGQAQHEAKPGRQGARAAKTLARPHA